MCWVNGWLITLHQNETGYLSPLFSMVEEKRTLADEMLESFHSSWNKRVELAFKNQMIN